MVAQTIMASTQSRGSSGLVLCGDAPFFTARSGDTERVPGVDIGANLGSGALGRGTRPRES